jgi:hypothetical protein
MLILCPISIYSVCQSENDHPCENIIEFKFEDCNDVVFIGEGKSARDTIMVIKNNSRYVFHLKDCSGTAEGVVISHGGDTVETFYFRAGLELMSDYFSVFNPTTNEVHLEVKNVYKAIRSGIWLYFYENGLIRERRVFDAAGNYDIYDK